jgi:Tfp pilus assembly protein PilF
LPSQFVRSDFEFADNVAEIAAGAGFLDSAATILNMAVFNNPKLLEARLRLAEIRLRQNSPQYALNTLAFVEDSKDPRVAILFAQAFLKLGRRDDAQKYVERAITLGGGEGLALLGKEVALKSLSNWLQQHPDALAAQKQYAMLLFRFGELATARSQYEQLVRAHPDDGLALNNLSWLVVKDDPGRALELAQRAVKQSPASPDFLDTLGCMQIRQSDPKGALSSLRQAHGFRPGDPEISYHLALAVDANGMRAPARALLAGAVAQGNFTDLDNARRLLASWR